MQKNMGAEIAKRAADDLKVAQAGIGWLGMSQEKQAQAAQQIRDKARAEVSAVYLPEFTKVAGQLGYTQEEAAIMARAISTESSAPAARRVVDPDAQ